MNEVPPSQRKRTRAVAWPCFSFAEPCGAVELAVAEAVQGAMPRPARVTALIARLFGTIDGEAASASLARSLAAGTREWLVQQAAARFRPSPDWLATSCSRCGEPADLPVQLADMPRSALGRDFPRVEVETSLGRRSFDLPNGSDEEALAVAAGDPQRLLAVRCGTGLQPDAELLRDEDLAAIDAAMDEAMPEPATSLRFDCPACGAANDAPLDPLLYGFPTAKRVLADVDRIASAYGWSEATILGLPIPRRRTYLDLIAARIAA